MTKRLASGVVRVMATIGLSLVVLVLGLLWLAWPSKVAVGAGDAIEVDPAGSDTATCGAALSPCRSIAYAVNHRASSGDVVLARPGTYTETITMRPGIVISGSGALETFIDGENVRGPMVMAGSGVTTSAVLRGFTIRRGHASRGGGLSVVGGASPVVEDCLISDSSASDSGGGVYVSASSPTFMDVEVGHNTAVRGGGVYIESSDSTSTIIGGLVLHDNEATGTEYNDGGGGLYARGSLLLSGIESVRNRAFRGGGLYQARASAWVTVTGGYFAQNAADSDGGGLFARGSLVLESTDVLSNRGANRGGGIHVAYNADLIGCKIMANTVVTSGGGLYQNEFSGAVTIVDSIFAENVVVNGEGGALRANAASLMMSDSRIVGNHASDSGGGIRLSYTGFSYTATLKEVELWNNTAGSDGGGLCGAYGYAVTGSRGSVTLVGGSVRGNSSGTMGGGLALGDTLIMTGTEVVNNVAAERGGGVYAHDEALVTNALLAGNAAPDGGGIYFRGESGAQTLRYTTIASPTMAHGSAIYVKDGDVSITNTIIASYTAGINQTGGTLNEDYNLYFGNEIDVQSNGGRLSSGGHSLFGQDPDFIDPVGGDYHIGRASAALGAATPLPDVTTDIDGDPRPMDPAYGGEPDIGSDERVTPTVTSISPAAGAKNVPVDTPIVIEFSKPIDRATLEVSVVPNPGGWSRAWSSADTVVTMSHNDFAKDATYTVTVSAFDDLAGNSRSGEPFVWSFSTMKSVYTIALPLVMQSAP